MANFTETFDSESVTIKQLFETIKKESLNSKLTTIDINRIRLTIGDAKGRALADKK